MKVLFFTQTTTRGASARYRVYQYLDYLNAQHIKTEVRTAISDDLYDEYHRSISHSNSKKLFFYSMQYLKRIRDIFDVKNYDIIFLQRDLIIHIFPLLEKIISYLNPRIVFDFDDAIYLVPPGIPGSPWRKLFYDKKKIERIIKLAAYTICGNDFLKRYAFQYSNRVTVIPTCLNPDEYEIRREYLQKQGPIIIGWIGTPFTTYYLKVVAEALKKVSQRYNVIFRIVGGKDVIMPGVKIEEVPWKEGREAEEIKKFDIGIMPLTDDEWSWGKCGFKLLQYMACGIPVVASPVGVNQEIIENGENGFLASTEDSWVNKLSQLIEDNDLSKKVGQAGRKTVVARYSREVNGPRLKDVLERVYNFRQ